MVRYSAERPRSKVDRPQAVQKEDSVKKEPMVFGTISSDVPRLGDNATFRARYDYNLSDTWAVQLSNRASKVARGGSNLRTPHVDVDAVLNFKPDCRIVCFTFAGIAYARANLDWPIQGGMARACVPPLAEQIDTPRAKQGTVGAELSFRLRRDQMQEVSHCVVPGNGEDGMLCSLSHAWLFPWRVGNSIV
jgi:hypothetical protein